jgi:serpin B
MVARCVFVSLVCSMIFVTPTCAQDEKIFSDLAEKQLSLGLSLLQQSPSESNRTVSPYSIHSGLMLARVGAKGETARQLDAVLSSAPFSSAVAQSYAALNRKVLANTDNLSVNLANSVWLAEQAEFTPEFKRITTATLSAESCNIDFTQTEKARKTINAWVSEKTKKLIPDLLPSGVLTKDTIATLVNALHFKAAWRHPFQEKATKDEDFWIKPSSSIKTPMMHSSESAVYFENKDWQAVNLDYAQGDYSYILLVPRQRLSAHQVAQALSLKLIREAHQSSSRARVQLTLPRFSIRESQDLASSLKKLGVVAPFTKDADFSGMSPLPTVIGAVQHESVVIVDEKGTEAAAATAVVMMKLSAIINPEPPKEVRADRPFAFAIVHNETKATLFLGTVGDPR